MTRPAFFIRFGLENGGAEEIFLRFSAVFLVFGPFGVEELDGLFASRVAGGVGLEVFLVEFVRGEGIDEKRIVFGGGGLLRGGLLLAATGERGGFLALLRSEGLLQQKGVVLP